MKQLKWGVIGASGIADRRMMPEGILQAENARLVAITGRDQVRLREIGSRYEGVQVCGSEDELLERDEVQAVYIATPNDL
ncbi:MAG TPA: Gfo/Idh/MocA family oxidoreductase, partial [Acidobacteriota bacterium]|nr:Gfo/Idh/MocA family oxidoreductase [Acidobacteriota bacterium]